MAPISDTHLVNCTILDVTHITGGPDGKPESYIENKRLCHELCHKIIDVVCDWQLEMFDEEHFKIPFVKSFIKSTENLIVSFQEYGNMKVVTFTKSRDNLILKITINKRKPWEFLAEI